MEECIFCKLIKKELPSYTIFENEYTLAFLDIAKDVDGHTIVIPKKHVVNILDCDQETLGHVIDTVKLISNHYVNNCGYTGINLLNASGTSAQQSVPHFHFHIIPRKKEDGVDAWPKLNKSEKSLGDMHRILQIQEN